MIPQVIFFQVPYSIIKEEDFIFSEKETGVNILINSSAIDTAILINFVRRFNYRYIYTLCESILTEPGIQTIFPDLYTLFCLSGCFRNNATNSIPVLLDETQTRPSILDELKDYFELQGEKSVKFAIFQSTEQEVQEANSLLLCTRAQLELFNHSLFEKFTTLRPAKAIITLSDPRNAEAEIVSIKSMINQNVYAKMFFEVCALHAALNWHRHQTTLWKARSDLYFSFISISKKVGETQYYDILNWYTKEYEVLPLWYKRFGHIIKFLTGKRSFRSLLNKPEKTKS